MVAGIIEKQYQASARYYRVQRGLLSPNSGDDDLDLTLSALLANIRQSAMQSFREGALQIGGNNVPAHHRLTMYNSALTLTVEQAKDLANRLGDLMAEFNDYSQQNKSGHAAQLYKLSLFYFPAEGESQDASPGDQSNT